MSLRHAIHPVLWPLSLFSVLDDYQEFALITNLLSFQFFICVQKKAPASSTVSAVQRAPGPGNLLQVMDRPSHHAVVLDGAAASATAQPKQSIPALKQSSLGVFFTKKTT
jgi:hypothetical protein